jgi:hypothetical protein
MTAADRLRVIDAVDAAARAADARIVAVPMLRPYGLAAAVTLSVDDPARFLRERAPLFGEALRRLPLDGSLVRVLDGDGRFAAAMSGVHTRTIVSASVQARRELRGCMPFFPDTSDDGPCGYEP